MRGGLGAALYNPARGERAANGGPNTHGIGNAVWIITVFTRATRAFTVTLGNARAGWGCLAGFVHLRPMAALITITLGNARPGLDLDLALRGVLVVHRDRGGR